MDDDTKENFAQYPDNIVVIGGGRWARVIIEVLCDLVPSRVRITVHTRHNIDSMVTWASATGLSERIQLTTSWPEFVSTTQNSAIIVTNAARDHEAAVEWGLCSGVPVLVEKPIALSYKSARRLSELADKLNGRLAAAQVFLYARYIENFSKIIKHLGTIDALYINWADPKNEDRYGEGKHYDAGLPVFADWLPHIIPIIGTLLPDPPNVCKALTLRRGGAALEIDLRAGNTRCEILLERNANQRKRIIQATVDKEVYRLDFSIEPGNITVNNSASIGDEIWDSGRRPLASMLYAFFQWITCDCYDTRLDTNSGLQSCKIIDQVAKLYNSQQIPWLIGKLSEPSLVDRDLRYALNELLSSSEPLSGVDLDRQIECVMTYFSSANSAKWSDKLANSHDTKKFLRDLVSEAT